MPTLVFRTGTDQSNAAAPRQEKEGNPAKLERDRFNDYGCRSPWQAVTAVASLNPCQKMPQLNAIPAYYICLECRAAYTLYTSHSQKRKDLDRLGTRDVDSLRNSVNTSTVSYVVCVTNFVANGLCLVHRKYEVRYVLNPTLQVSLPSLPSRWAAGADLLVLQSMPITSTRRTDTHLAILIDNEKDGHTALGVLNCETQEAFTCSDPSRREQYRQRQIPIVRLDGVRLTRSLLGRLHFRYRVRIQVVHIS
ncbi:hypothetical protein F5B22DRAFT_458792 [Xylaria bambusicola]|uniref:uncharacterized protein n=1 Tax=Xylaria bambusicola TaxID=326684 RepID=UPI00200790CD|nr:uncharacterized protein F5B22DRAFT_458792 [Xylaria bambusicola]KAI0522104.1 hypothetical protein F5B22DRAFT_458792 [Xylaria bambusicola]